MRYFLAYTIVFTLISCGGDDNSGSGITTPADTVPDQFSFSDQTDAERNTEISSNAITVLGINTGTGISITEGEYSIDGGAYTSSAGTVSNGQSVVVRLQSSENFLTTTEATLTIGGVSDTFSVTTVAEDNEPDAFSFTDQTNVALNTQVVSDAVIVAGINIATSISITGGEYSIDGGAYTASTASVSNGSSVSVRQTSAGSYSTSTDIVLTIGGISDTFSVTTLPDTLAPTASITFPTAKSYTDADNVTVRGTAGDNDAVTSVTVNGVPATTSDNFATWFANIPVVQGAQTITVTATDAAGNQNKASAALAEITGIKLRLGRPQAVELDQDNDRALVIDRTYKALFSIDLLTGDREIISDRFIPNTDQPFRVPRDMVFDKANNRVLLIDVIGNGNGNGLVAVDLDTGERSIFSSNSVPDGNNPFIAPSSMALDLDNDRLLVVGSADSQLLSVDLNTGARTIISNLGTPNSDNPFTASPELAYDDVNNRALVMDKGMNRLLAVNLTTGERTILSDAATPNGNNPFNTPGKIEFDGANNRLFVINFGSDEILAVNLSNGERSVFYDITTMDQTDRSSAILDLSLDTANNRMLMADSGLKALLSLALNTAEPSVLSAGNASNTGLRAERMVMDRENNRLLVADIGNSAVVAVDMDQGTVTVISDDTTPNGNNSITSLIGITWDQANNRVLVTDADLNNGAVLAVDLSTGERTIVSNNTTPNGDNPLDLPFGLGLDVANNRVLVANSYPVALVSVDLDSGARTIISDENTSNGLHANLGIDGIALDLDNNRALLANYSSGYESVLSVDLSSGVSTVISDNTTPNSDNPFATPTGISLDAENNRAFVTDWGGGSLFSVDLSSGARTVISSPSLPNSANTLGLSTGMALDFENNRVFVGDSSGGLFVVDLSDGQRVLLAH